MEFPSANGDSYSLRVKGGAWGVSHTYSDIWGTLDKD